MLNQEQARSVCAGRTVLVVDDRESVRDVLRAILEDAGARVFEAATVTQAQAVLDRAAPDAVLTDLELTPHWRGGQAVLEQVKRQSLACPVILLTAWSDESDKLRAMGFDAVLLKPAAPVDLITAVGSCIERRRSASTAA
jgi:CheY-like chemotaxis protein